ncbi:hypothetical protein L1987_51146 [Smallanthus sonchifolius]|uniref:Uncharacterized protein n=1 Tax=Smallanthus sonchifolius TaxID=185202 RepID=A0ACB9EPH0_9ASTR|nr:hypothetical protein L1987_51146 [Smallanthus sonchifolius]
MLTPLHMIPVVLSSIKVGSIPDMSYSHVKTSITGVPITLPNKNKIPNYLITKRVKTFPHNYLNFTTKSNTN